MSYAAILVHAEAEPQSEPRLRLAANLANDFDATLIGVGAEAIYPVVVGGFGEVMVTAGGEAVQQDLKAAESNFRQATRHIAKGVEWRSQQDFPETSLARHARAADLIVAGPTPAIGVGLYGAADPGELLMETGRPILVAPRHATLVGFGSIVVGWKDTREARRAIADALPFLKRAAQVVVVQVCEEADEAKARTSVDDVAAALRRHDVRAVAVVAPSGPVTVLEALMNVVDVHEADLLVIGGYGHSRLREWVFGGVTRSLLRDPPLPVLMSR